MKSHSVDSKPKLMDESAAADYKPVDMPASRASCRALAGHKSSTLKFAHKQPHMVFLTVVSFSLGCNDPNCDQNSAS